MEEIKLIIPKPHPNAFHNSSLQEFNNLLYKDVLTNSNISSREQIYNFTKLGAKTGFKLEKHNDLKTTYFLETEHIDKLPLKIKETKKDSFRTDVFHLVTKVVSVKIPSSRETSFRNVVDWLCNFEHDRPLHWTLYKILIIVATIDRINFRVATEAGFGKDSVVNAIIELVNQTANIYGATFAKLEYYLLNNFLFFNELGGLKDSDKSNMQTFLLETGDFKNKYGKHSRKTADTKEIYDISNTSVGVASNTNEYYTQKNQQPFVSMFTKAANNRFLPLKFEGVLTQDFSKNFNVNNMVTANKRFYQQLIGTINWYRQNNTKVQAVDWHYNPTRDFGYGGLRRNQTYNTICKYISLYAHSKAEYQHLTDELYKCYKSQVKDDQHLLDSETEVHLNSNVLEEFVK